MIPLPFRFMRGWRFLIVFAKPINGGYGGGESIQGDSDFVQGLLYDSMVRQGEVKDLVLNATLKYLEEYKVDQKKFIQELYKNK